MEKTLLGRFTDYFHGISGDIYSMGDRRLLIEKFKYDGTGPDAFFWVGTQGKGPSSESGILLAHPFRGKFYDYDDPDAPILRRFDGKQTPIVLTLPDGLKVTDLKWISVWCRRFAINFGDFIFSSQDIQDENTFETTTKQISKNTCTAKPPIALMLVPAKHRAIQKPCYSKTVLILLVV